MEIIKKYPLGQLFGTPFKKKDFVVLNSDEILRLIKDDINSGVQQYHRHDFYAISWIESGELLQKLDGKLYTLRKGDIFIACPGQVHENDFGQTADQAKGGAFLFSAEFLQQLKHTTAISEITFLDNVFSNPHLSLPSGDRDSFLGIIHILFREVDKGLPNLALVKSLFSSVLLLIQQIIDISIIRANSARHIEVYKTLSACWNSILKRTGHWSFIANYYT